jgi:DNA (cytosine-5)-methyltransferase 1
MLRAIREIQPTYVVGENVFGIVNLDGGMVFEQVQADLETEGYEVQSYILPACAVNAPHRRDRVWFVAHHSNARIESMQPKRTNHFHGFGITSDTDITSTKHQIQTGGYKSSSKNENLSANTECNGLQRGESKYGIWTQDEEKQIEICNGIPRFDNFPSKPGICGRDDGISDRVDRIKALGNAIVPQVAYQIFKAIEQFENSIQLKQGYGQS